MIRAEGASGSGMRGFAPHDWAFVFSSAYKPASIENKRRFYRLTKRFFDIALSSMALALLFPAMAVIALAIWLDKPHGNPFYISTRIGKDKKPFKFYKFRTMTVDAEIRLESLLAQNEASGPAFKIKDDPRITRIGKILRKYSIDEVPQLINILKGDMSFVGPRPPIPREVAQYTKDQARRLSVKPGLTCYWQVQPHRNSIPFDVWMDMDRTYIANRCLSLDLYLILITFKAVLKGDGE